MYDTEIKMLMLMNLIEYQCNVLCILMTMSRLYVFRVFLFARNSGAAALPRLRCKRNFIIISLSY